MEDLLAEFIAESRDMLEALSGEIVAWEADPADRARLDAIFRFVHTVKGNCGFFEFQRPPPPARSAASRRPRGRSACRSNCSTGS